MAKTQTLSMEERAKSLYDHSSVMDTKAHLTSLIQLELVLRNNDRRVKDKLSLEDIKKLKAMLKEPQPQGFKVFLKAAIEAITKADLNPQEVLHAVCDAERAFFEDTSDYERAFALYRETVKAKL
jgi:hypothetical protein